jgi:superfamily II DNA helicase RecQ
MVSHQTVIVVVPFAALVDDLMARARKHQLVCEEWQWQRQWEWRALPPLLIVSADRASEDDFLHFAKGLELNQQLAHVFFDECHVAVTDTSYRAKLRELWQL